MLGEVRGADSLANNLVANDQTMRLQLTLLFLSKLYSMNFNLKTSIYLITYTTIYYIPYDADCLVISDSQVRLGDYEISLPTLPAEFAQCWRRCEVQIPQRGLICLYLLPARIPHSILCPPFTNNIMSVCGNLQILK